MTALRIPEQAVAALKRGDKIEAVALTKSALGLDLAEARQAVDAYLEADPKIMRRALSERSTGGGALALILIGIAAAVAYAVFVAGMGP